MASFVCSLASPHRHTHNKQNNFKLSLVYTLRSAECRWLLMPDLHFVKLTLQVFSNQGVNGSVKWLVLSAISAYWLVRVNRIKVYLCCLVTSPLVLFHSPHSQFACTNPCVNVYVKCAVSSSKRKWSRRKTYFKIRTRILKYECL